MTAPQKNDGSDIRNALRLVALVGLVISGNILTGAWAGINLDAHFQTNRLLTATGILVGLTVGLAMAVWLLLRASPPR